MKLEFLSYVNGDKKSRILKSPGSYVDNFSNETRIINKGFIDGSIYYKGSTYANSSNEDYKLINKDMYEDFNKNNSYSYWMSHQDAALYMNPTLQLSNRINELSYFFNDWNSGTIWNDPNANPIIAQIYNNIHFTNMGSDLGYTVTYNPNISENIKIVKLDRINDKGNGKINQTTGLVDFDDEGYQKNGRPINSFVEFVVVGLNGVKIEGGKDIHIGEKTSDEEPIESSIYTIKMAVKPNSYLPIQKLEDFKYELYKIEKEVTSEKWFNSYGKSDGVNYILDSYNRGWNLFGIYNFYNSFAHYYDLMKKSRQTRVRNLTDAEIIDGFNKASFTEKDEALAKIGNYNNITFLLHVDKFNNHYVRVKFKNEFGINIEKDIKIDDAYKLDNTKYNQIVASNNYYKEYSKYKDWRISNGDYSVRDIRDDFNYKSHDKSGKEQELYEAFGGLIPKIKLEGTSGRTTKLELIGSGEINIDLSKVSHENYWANYNEPLNEALKSKTKFEKIDYLVYRYFNAFFAWKRQSYEILLEKAFMPDKVKYYDNNAEKMKIYFKEFENGWYINKWEEPNNIKKALKELGLKNFKFIIHKNEHENDKFGGYYWDAFFTYETENKNNFDTNSDIFLNRSKYVYNPDTDTKVSFGIPHGDYNPKAEINMHVEDYPWFPKHITYYYDKDTINNNYTYEYSEILSFQNSKGNYNYLLEILHNSRVNWTRHADRKKEREKLEAIKDTIVKVITNPIGFVIEELGGSDQIVGLTGFLWGFVSIPGYSQLANMISVADNIVNVADGFDGFNLSKMLLDSFGVVSSLYKVTSYKNNGYRSMSKNVEYNKYISKRYINTSYLKLLNRTVKDHIIIDADEQYINLEENQIDIINNGLS
ncbi:MAG: hypothetical protein HRT99_04325, partial [Mycoplasmatales bacterium]|nr:hypothetical protein [Mycoplasmatales bacterium]